MDYRSIVTQILGERRILASPLSYVSQWKAWYKGTVKNFHNYTIYNGSEDIRLRKLSLNMAKRVCEDWAGLLINERVQVSNTDSDSLTKLLEDADFFVKANKAVEQGFALSMSALVIDFDAQLIGDTVQYSKATLSAVTANKIIPITFENDKIVECAFINEGTQTTTVTMHLRGDDGLYFITVVIVDNRTGKQSEPYEFNTGSIYPWFTIIHPNIVNNIDPDSPYPISIFANGIDVLKSIDNKYDSFNNEFVLGRKRVYISAKALHVDKVTGAIIKTFDPNDVTFYVLPEKVSAQGESTPFVKTDTDMIRAQEHQTGIQNDLNIFATLVGLGNGYYDFTRSGRVMTATQVISERSDLFRNKCRHEKLLATCMREIISAYVYAKKIIDGYSIQYDPDELVIRFDDSIIQDKDAELVNDRQDVSAGIMSKAEFRAKYYGETLEEAQKYINTQFGDEALVSRLNAFSGHVLSGTITVEAFVDNVYPDASNKPELVEQIREAITANAGAGMTVEDLGLGGTYIPPAPVTDTNGGEGNE